MNLNDYHYNLPQDMIAQHPAEPRDTSRLMIINTENDTISHSVFSNLTGFINSNDLLVVNDTKVFPARLIGKKETSGGSVEIFLLKRYNDGTWDALSRPAKRLKIGSVIMFGEGLLSAEILEKGESGHVRVKLDSEVDIDIAIDKLGKTPLPPYIKHAPDSYDSERYQTVYARTRGAVAAPTAGLHFTPEMLDKIESIGVKKAPVTLHVGIGTFRPLSEEEADGDHLHSEYCTITKSTADMVKDCRANGGRVIAVGTTTARALESASASGEIVPFDGWTDIFIKPPYRFKSVDSLITNFHLPCSSLLMMVGAFAGRQRILNAYDDAVKSGYRFYSYGDAMFITGSAR
ncbi:tRNA preQ1(34) S-adenosylmethionine ribosyltransferase-isomerase QueA [Candidatus Latescibacterota bacterium]